MSLLLDALKRAEQEKLAKQGDRPANDVPPASGTAAPKREPASTAGLELQPMAAANAASAAPPKPAGAATAQAVFQAKSAPAMTGDEVGRNLMPLWIAAVVILFVVIGIGGYVWWSINSMPQQITTLPRRTPASGPVTPPAKVETLVPGAPAPSAPRPDSATPAVPAAPTGIAGAPQATAAPANTASLAPTVSVAPAPAAAARPEDTGPAPRNNAEAAARLVREAPSAPTLQLAPTPPPRVSPDVAAGYEALRAGDIEAARRRYTAAYAADPSSIDANLGIATVEARLGNVGVAAAHYRRVLDVDPGNATAIAGLASMADGAQPERLEQGLRADVARYPQSAALHFALGNLYASRGRWEEAQASFFEALRVEPANPDTLYNLAVALDHMGQARLAVDYYGRAVAAAHGRNATFNAALVERRIAELKP